VRRRKLLISVLAVAALSGGYAVWAMPASAERHTIVVTLAGGGKVVLNIDVPPGTPLSQIRIPNLGLPIVSVEDITPPPAQSTPLLPLKPTPTPATPVEPANPTEKPEVTKPEKPDANAGVQVGATRVENVQTAPRRNRPATRDKLGRPTLDNPTISFALPGPGRIGIPDFFIEKFRIPPFLLSIYQAAGIEYNVPWQVLAAINEIETDYGRKLSVSTAGAVGWMQFLPSTWKRYAVDANADNIKDPYNPVDAIFAAARYLRAAGAEKDLRRAIFAYNHADWYVDSVLVRAKLIGGLPADLVGSLTGLTQGHFPVAAKSVYADDVAETAQLARASRNAGAIDSTARRSIAIFSRRGAPVIAVNDGVIKKVGSSAKLGRYIVLQDVYGNRYIYAHLGKIAPSYPAPRPQTVTSDQIRSELKLPRLDPKPTAPASAGAQAAAVVKHATSAVASVAKERLFANPNRPAAYRAGGDEQLLSLGRPVAGFSNFESYFKSVLGLRSSDVVLKKLRAGSHVIAGTILGRIDKTAENVAPHLLFEIRPAGRGAPLIDPKPILDGWKLLESTAIYRAAGRNPFFGPDAKNPTIGQILLMSKDQLERRVLANPRIEIYGCGRRDVRAGQIDRRVLATLEFLAASGLRPTVTSLRCGHGYYTKSGNVSEHSSGNAVDIAAINGIPILGHQGKGSITELAVRRLLTLQGAIKPHQIITLMKFDGTDNTFAMGDHADHIHVGFRPLFGSNTKLARQFEAILKPGQWIKLIGRISEIDNPTVPTKPSKYSIKVPRASAAHRGE
jgi:hypothetical protein